jgi:hypothetical protein
MRHRRDTKGTGNDAYLLVRRVHLHAGGGHHHPLHRIGRRRYGQAQRSARGTLPYVGLCCGPRREKNQKNDDSTSH